MMYYPGRVTNVALLLARVNNTHRWDWMTSASNAFPFDSDITGNYHDTIANHLLHATTGIHTNATLWGDSAWYSNLANDEVYHLLHKLVLYLRGASGGEGGADAFTKLHRLVFSSHIFDTAHGKLHDVSRREIISSETSIFKQCLPAGDNRSILCVRLFLTLNECECSVSIYVPPPYDNCTWDVHHYLRSRDEALVQTNSLSAFVIHIGSAEPPNEEVLTTLQQIKFKICAPIPNTQAATFLVARAKEQLENPPPQAGNATWSQQRAEELLEELKAMEGELVAVRAAFVASKEREQALQAHIQRSGAGGVAQGRPLLLDPSAVQREQLRVSEEILRRLNVDYVDLNRRLALVEKAVGVTGDVRLRAMLFWRQQEGEALLQRLSEAHLFVVQGGGAGALMAPIAGRTPFGNVVADVRAAASGGVAHPNAAPAAAGGPNVAMNRVAMDQPRLALEANVDPLLLLYQGHLVELENEVGRMTDVDAKACVDQYYVNELAKMEKDLVHWVTRARVAESQNKLYEQALKAKDGRK